MFVHEQGICESTTVGDGTTVWAFAHVLPGARIGTDCNINDHVFIENDVIIGDRVTIKSGVQIWDGVRLADDVFVGPNVTFTNDRFPRSKVRPAEFLVTEIGPGASLGANSTILPGVRVGRRAMVGAGSVVTRTVPPFAIVVGNPARITGYVDSDEHPRGHIPAKPAGDALTPNRVAGVSLLRMVHAEDMRGELVAVEFAKQLPFVPSRMFVVYGVPSKEVRGEHAHIECEEFLVCVAGHVAVVVDDGVNRQEFVLDSPEVGLHLAPRLWTTQYAYSPDARLVVLASHDYDPDDYIRNYEEFLEFVRTP